MDALINTGVSDNGINDDTLMNNQTMVTQSPPSFTTDNDESFTTTQSESSTEEVNALLMLSQQPSTEGTTAEPKATELSLNMSSSNTPAPTKIYKPSPPPSEKEKFSCAEILAGMQATWEVAEEVTTDINASLKPQPRKRGRPRKNPDAPPKVKRPRGRPRKDGTPPVQRKDKDKAAEMLLMLHLQGSKEEEEDSSDDEHPEHPTKYANYSKKVVNVGGIKAVASNANMTTRQGSRHGKKLFGKDQQGAGSPLPEKKKARMVATRPNNKRKAPVNVKLSASNINSRVKKRINAGKESKAVKDRINKASQIVNARYGEPGPARQKKLRALIVRGITCRPSGKWQAQVYYNRKSRYLGVYDSKESAALAYEVAREVLRTDESWGTDLCAHNVNDAKKTNEEIGIARRAAIAIIAEDCI